MYILWVRTQLEGLYGHWLPHKSFSVWCTLRKPWREGSVWSQQSHQANLHFSSRDAQLENLQRNEKLEPFDLISESACLTYEVIGIIIVAGYEGVVFSDQI